MPSDPDVNDPRNLWQNQEQAEDEKMTITIDEIRRRAGRLERRIRWRNLRECGAGAVVIAFFSVQLWRGHGWRLTPALLLIAGTLYVMFQLHRRGAARSLPADAGLSASLDFHLRELERQRDALQTVWLWYLLPFVPGFLAAFVVTAIDRGINARIIISGVVGVLLLVGIWRLNEWAARKLDLKIQELRGMEIDDERPAKRIE
jgi:hypothetical protein